MDGRLLADAANSDRYEFLAVAQAVQRQLPGITINDQQFTCFHGGIKNQLLKGSVSRAYDLHCEIGAAEPMGSAILCNRFIQKNYYVWNSIVRRPIRPAVAYVGSR